MHFVHRQVSYYDYALDLILDADTPSAEILTDEQHELVESAAETLYGLIHVRCAQACRCLTLERCCLKLGLITTLQQSASALLWVLLEQAFTNL